MTDSSALIIILELSANAYCKQARRTAMLTYNDMIYRSQSASFDNYCNKCEGFCSTTFCRACLGERSSLPTPGDSQRPLHGRASEYRVPSTEYRVPSTEYHRGESFHPM